MYFAEFFKNESPAVGDRSVIILDGRERRSSHFAHARLHGTRHGFTHFRICKGEAFNRNVTALSPRFPTQLET